MQPIAVSPPSAPSISTHPVLQVAGASPVAPTTHAVSPCRRLRFRCLGRVLGLLAAQHCFLLQRPLQWHAAHRRCDATALWQDVPDRLSAMPPASSCDCGGRARVAFRRTPLAPCVSQLWHSAVRHPRPSLQGFPPSSPLNNPRLWPALQTGNICPPHARQRGPGDPGSLNWLAPSSASGLARCKGRRAPEEAANAIWCAYSSPSWLAGSLRFRDLILFWASGSVQGRRAHQGADREAGACLMHRALFWEMRGAQEASLRSVGGWAGGEKIRLSILFQRNESF